MDLRKYQNQYKKLTIKRKGEVLKKLQKNKCKKTPYEHKEVSVKEWHLVWFKVNLLMAIENNSVL